MYVDSSVWPLRERDDGDQTVSAALRAALEPLFLRHGVDATWSGHHHSYQRTCHVAAGACVAAAAGVQRAPVHVVMGHAGAALTPNLRLLRPRIFETVQLRHGYVRVQANATHLRHVAVASAGGAVMDDFTLTKLPPPQPAAAPGAGGSRGGRGARLSRRAGGGQGAVAAAAA
jgi:hypothetical protein